MKNLLFTIALLISFSSFGQEDIDSSYEIRTITKDSLLRYYKTLPSVNHPTKQNPSFSKMLKITIEYFKQNGVNTIEGIYWTNSKTSNFPEWSDDYYSFKVIIEGPPLIDSEFIVIDSQNPRNHSLNIFETFNQTLLMYNRIHEGTNEHLSFSVPAIISGNEFIYKFPENWNGINNFMVKDTRFFPDSSIPINISQPKKNKKSGWSGNGSGVIVSKSGHIITNNHVIEGAKNIEIELISNGETENFNAEVVQKDLRNDLAILKIVDVNFDAFGAINYNFKALSCDVGTKIYTFSYPKALSGMGKEIKVTEGIISSKTGIMGDITTYQITAPVQGGNSGGPLFDDKGNLVGINSSRFKSDETENVNYSIKSSYILNLIDVLPKSIDLPSSTKLQSLPLTEQIKEISKYVVLVKVK